MIEWNSSLPNLQFRVQVGLMSVSVRARTQREAIEEARHELCRELPWMWDVIQSMPNAQFEIIHDANEN